MPHILLLRLSAPMQAWGVMSRFSRRDTGKEPSKSGVIGLLCAAMGISRDDVENEDFARLRALEMGVRVLREGVLQSDYHTAQNIAKADGGIKETELSTRFYLADADFVVALAGRGEDKEVLNKAQGSLKNPHWQLFLGRKSFVPAEPVYFRDGVRTIDRSLREFLTDENPRSEFNKLLADHDGIFDGDAARRSRRQRVIIEDETEGTEVRQDVPLSFAERRFTVRRVRTRFIEIGGKTDERVVVDEN